MPHEYHVQTSDGQSFTVTTDQHHDDHTDKGFRDHLLDVIKQAVAQIASGVFIHHYTYRGRK